MSALIQMSSFFEELFYYLSLNTVNADGTAGVVPKGDESSRSVVM